MRVRRFLALLACLAAALALASGWRWRELRRAVDTNRRAMTAAVRDAATAASGGDASGRVAVAVHENEARFEVTLRLAAARRTAGWLCLTCTALALAFGASAYRRDRRR